MIKINCEEYDFKKLAEAFEGETESDCGLSAEIIICSEEQIQKLNREIRGVDCVTDVLSFPSLDGIRGRKLFKKDFPADVDEDGNLFLGSIAVCEQRAKEQAEEYGHGYLRELYYLAAHGIFHLLGYDHMNDADKLEMRGLEEKVLGKIGVTR